MIRNTALRTALGAAFAAAIGFAAPAHALDAKQCGTRAEIAAALQSEGQVQIISGQRTALGGPKNIFTTNRDLSLGYNVESGVGPEAGMSCVGAKYTNIRLNSDPHLARPGWASFGPNTAHDRYLSQMEAKSNNKVLMGANVLIPQPDGSEREGAFIMVERGEAVPGTGFTSAGIATATGSTGGVTTFISMANVEPNDNFSALAKRRVQTAAADPVVYSPR